MTPLLAQKLGDVLAHAGLAEEAVRTYSEIVERNRSASSMESRISASRASISASILSTSARPILNLVKIGSRLWFNDTRSHESDQFLILDCRLQSTAFPPR